MNIFIQQSKAEMLRMFRNPYYIFWSLTMPILFYFVFTKVMNVTKDDPVLNAHFLMSMTAFSVMGSSIMTLGIRLVEERAQGWTTFMRVTPLSSYTYFAAKIVGQTIVHVFSILVIFTAGALVNKVTLSVGEWLLSGGWILLGSLPFLWLGVLIGTMKRVDTAVGVSNILYMGLAITGGMWMPIDIMPEVVQWIGKSLPAFHFGNGAWSIIRGNAPDWMNIVMLAAYLVLFMILSTYIRRRQEAV
ncbi:ABC transporter permease [Siminovitchia sp. FSL H7-0308]|uniref:ABC-2 type transport system permease protein n=1 Tax=Siminovitchia thermophila TaxID=1245522 RepID=A0ABS2R965_9BACI|nr:ABC transporter permease [Siminovitchia thermophila]MBM7716178.1 ABC-2 type transport system permease protein [Siminovitchia thermophila]ONK21474.1 ABC transporter permease [Bacillus sp. VT-16-64]